MIALKDYMNKKQIKTLADVISPYFSGNISCNPEAIEKKEEIVLKYGSVDSFLKNSEFKLISGPDDIDLEKFYKLYSSIFTVPEECGSLEGFKQILSFNNDLHFKEKFGNFEYSIIFATEPVTGNLMGGISFSNYVMSKNMSEKSGIGGTNQIAYIFVDPIYRKALVGKELYKKMELYSQNFVSGIEVEKAFTMALEGEVVPANMYYFAEFEAPELLIADLGKDWFVQKPDLAVEQMRRLAWWDKMGFRRIQMPYIQPALSEDEAPCTILSLNVKGSCKDYIHKVILNEHLNRFFNIVVLKGKDMSLDTSYKIQMDILNSCNAKVPVVSINEHYKQIQISTPVKIFN